MYPDHIHMLVEIPPKYSVSSFMGYLKGKSSLMIFKEVGFTAIKSKVVDAPYIQELPVNLECKIIAVLQNPLVTVGTVERPRQHGHHIAPERRAVLLVAQNVRHDLRHTHIGAKLAGKVAQPLRHKRHNVLIERRRGAERGHVAGPAQTLAALGAVGGDVQEVIPLAPLDVLLQAVHPLVGAGKTACLLQIGGEMARRKLHVLPVLQPLHAQIAEAVPCKMRVQNLPAAA